MLDFKVWLVLILKFILFNNYPLSSISVKNPSHHCAFFLIEFLFLICYNKALGVIFKHSMRIYYLLMTRHFL